MPLERLNLEQHIAAVSTAPMTLIRAGAGTGKTSTLVARTFYLMRYSFGPLLFMAFNKKIVGEVTGKFQSTLPGYIVEKTRVVNSNAIAWELLLKHYALLGWDRPPTLFDKSWELLDAFRSYQVDELGLSRDNLPGELELKITYDIETKALKLGRAMTPDWVNKKIPYEWRKKPQTRRRRSRYALDEEPGIDPQDVIRWGRELRTWRHMTGNLVFADQIHLAVQLPQECFDHIEVVKFTAGIKHLLVDEAQDLSKDQHELVKRLGNGAVTITAVGDLGQSIYSFNGAAPEIFEAIPTMYPGCEVYKLQTNYRCSNEIIELANKVLEHDLGYDIRLNPPAPNYCGPVELYADEQQIVDWLKTAIASTGGDWSKIAVLYRSHAHIPNLEAILQSEGIPYYTAKSGFFESDVVREIVGWLKFCGDVSNRKDWEYVFKTFRFLGKNVGDEVWNRTQGEPYNWYDHYPDDIPAAAKGPKKSKLWGQLWRHRAAIVPNLMTGDLLGCVDYLITHVLNTTWLEKTGGNLDAVRENREIATALRDFIEKRGIATLPDLTRFVEGHKEDKPEGVQLITVHASKGLEFPYVAVWALGPRSFPITDLEMPSGLDPDEEADWRALSREEIHLLYVAATRAMKNLALFLRKDDEACRQAPLVRHVKDEGSELLALINAQ